MYYDGGGGEEEWRCITEKATAATAAEIVVLVSLLRTFEPKPFVGIWCDIFSNQSGGDGLLG